MHHFSYRDGILHCEDVPLATIAAAVGTPVYVYSTATLRRHWSVFTGALAEAGLDTSVHFATKANGNRAVLRTLADLGAGADVVSGGELYAALHAGIPASRIVFSGVGKTRDDLAYALDQGIFQINVESEPELRLLDAVAREKGVKAPIAIRVNPDVEAGTHEKITTGKLDNKFGIAWTQAHGLYRLAAGLDGIEVKAIAMHIGSQIADLAPFAAAFRRMRDLLAILRADGIAIERLDIGGGLGVPYDREGDPTPMPPADYAKVIRQELGDLGCKILLEPGRLITANAGVLLTRVIYRKEGATRTFLIVDAGMNDLVRPAMYDAFHDIAPVAEPAAGSDRELVDVVGPICESSDIFAKQRSLPRLEADDLLVLRTAGAYGAAMSNSYNGRPLVPEVLVNGDQYAVVRRRPSWEEMVALEDLAPWQQGG
ncbi:diaminopimelate decarboxylase [Caenispirillum bisanense]|uniref:diaminopimelate decarboxylase n=1 Tax=Caenispirillum bisanense TaxID=414052 RepID=UPI0031DDB3C5